MMFAVGCDPDRTSYHLPLDLETPLPGKIGISSRISVRETVATGQGWLHVSAPHTVVNDFVTWWR